MTKVGRATASERGEAWLPSWVLAACCAWLSSRPWLGIHPSGVAGSSLTLDGGWRRHPCGSNRRIASWAIKANLRSPRLGRLESPHRQVCSLVAGVGRHELQAQTRHRHRQDTDTDRHGEALGGEGGGRPGKAKRCETVLHSTDSTGGGRGNDGTFQGTTTSTSSSIVYGGGM